MVPHHRDCPDPKKPPKKRKPQSRARAAAKIAEPLPAPRLTLVQRLCAWFDNILE